MGKKYHREIIEFTPAIPSDSYTASYHRESVRCTVNALEIGLGLSYQEAFTLVTQHKRVRCRADQFGMFMMIRNEKGMRSNGFKNLKTCFVDEEPCKTKCIDVSGNPA